ncbi:hypothetical protein GOQ30_06760 [Flavobacterium sp. TP390]|uniref:Collagen-like protein n=1 Tax=Flavobacterium profundi TaxID=1774945 RepID=A0A6I4IH23_9FLAO|nr:collagen-like protein [Flavobacterium profundi]MVO08864.1 hypothetical protein [Flavobacterium profundi]
MKKFKFISYLPAAVLILTLMSCSAEDGVDGQEGPQGIQGPAGADGLDGVDGQDGQDGNANVVASGWLPADWSFYDTPTKKIMRVVVNQFTQTELRNECLVMVYARQYGTSAVYSIPGPGRWSNVAYNLYFGSNSPNADGILIEIKSTENGVDLTDYQYDVARGNYFRYVIIPSNQTNRLPDLSDYEQVKAYYNLVD